MRRLEQRHSLLDQAIDIERGWMRCRLARKFGKRAYAPFECFNLVDDDLNCLIHELPIDLCLTRGDLFDSQTNRCERVLQLMRHFSGQHLPARNLSEVHETFAALLKLLGHVVERADSMPGLIIARLPEPHLKLA